MVTYLSCLLGLFTALSVVSAMLSCAKFFLHPDWSVYQMSESNLRLASILAISAAFLLMYLINSLWHQKVAQRRSYKCPHEIGSVRSCCSDYLQGQSQGFPYIHLFVAAHHHIRNWQPHIDFPSMPYLINLLIITHALQWNREPDVTSNLLLWRTAAV